MSITLFFKRMYPSKRKQSCRRYLHLNRDENIPKMMFKRYSFVLSPDQNFQKIYVLSPINLHRLSLSSLITYVKIVHPYLNSISVFILFYYFRVLK